MAESDNVRKPSLQDWYDGSIIAASYSADEGRTICELPNLVELKQGFRNADVYITEVATGKNARAGTCVLMQNPASWEQKDRAPRRWAVTAAHCVCVYAFGKAHKYKKNRILAPRWSAWDGFPETKSIENGKSLNDEFYEAIPISRKQIMIHPRYNGVATSGYDVAMIAIPERAVRDQSLNFNMIDADNLPELICISGYPVVQQNNELWSHIPYYSLRARTEEDDSTSEDDSDEWQITFVKRTVSYPLRTQHGMSGGAVIIGDQIVGIHNAYDEMVVGRSIGTVFSRKLKKWMSDTYNTWDSIMSPKVGYMTKRSPEKSQTESRIENEEDREPSESKRSPLKRKRSVDQRDIELIRISPQDLLCDDVTRMDSFDEHLMIRGSDATPDQSDLERLDPSLNGAETNEQINTDEQSFFNNEMSRSIRITVPSMIESDGSGINAKYEDNAETEVVELQSFPKLSDARSLYYAHSGGTVTPLALRTSFGISTRTASMIKIVMETFSLANYVWVLLFNLFFDPGERWTVYVQITIYIFYFSHIASYMYYGEWVSEVDEETCEPTKHKPYFATVESIENRPLRFFLKGLYMIGFGKPFQYFFMYISTTDEDYEDEVNGSLWLSYSELFFFYVPTILLQTITIEIAGYDSTNLPTFISIYICTIKNVAMMLYTQNYLYHKDYIKCLIFIAQIAADIFFRTYTFALMTVHISYWSALILPFIYIFLNCFDSEWFTNNCERVYYGLLFTPLHTVSNILFLYSSTLGWKIILVEHFFRFAIGLFVISYQHENFGNIFSFLITGALFLATVLLVYILKYHDTFKSQDELT